jgi:hypothetical protein
MDDRDWPAGRFERHRPRLQLMAHRMPGSFDRPRSRGATGGLGRCGAAGRARNPESTERVAFVLHDLFDVPFDEIGPAT